MIEQHNSLETRQVWFTIYFLILPQLSVYQIKLSPLLSPFMEDVRIRE
jgi:hypothetical protein